MTFFVWNENLSVGNTLIDNDHRHLVDLVNHLYDEMDEGRGQSVAGAVLNELVQYTQEHFKREEDVMQGMRYAEFSTHKKEHENLTVKVLVLREKFINGEPNLAVELLVFLYDFLFNHIMQVDKKLGQAIQECAPGWKSQA